MNQEASELKEREVSMESLKRKTMRRLEVRNRGDVGEGEAAGYER
jgi:hypothetical protein